MKKKFKLKRAKTDDLPATRGMLKSVRTEVLLKMSAMEKRMSAKFDILRAEIREVRAETQLSNLKLEEQRADNRIVLEGIQALWQKQDQMDKRAYG